jgi:hypothetical protein
MENPMENIMETTVKTKVFHCSKCSSEISNARVQYFIETDGRPPEHCLTCSEEIKNVGFMVFSHKTAPELVRLKNPSKETLRQARNAHTRGANHCTSA